METLTGEAAVAEEVINSSSNTGGDTEYHKLSQNEHVSDDDDDHHGAASGNAPLMSRTKHKKSNSYNDNIDEEAQEGDDSNREEGEAQEEESIYPNNEDPDDMTKDYMTEKNELTMRAIISGCIVGALVGIMNVNFGLRTGWTQGGSIFAAILVIGIFKIIGPAAEFSRYEAVIATTTASAAGTMASAGGLVSSIPALKLLGHSYSVWELYLWVSAIAYFGVFFAVPLRKQMIIHEKLRFPTGTVTAFTIKSMIGSAAETVFKAQLMIITAVSTGIYSLFSYFIPYLLEPPLPKVITEWGWSIYISPLLLGGGMLSGLRASASILMGGIVGWGILGPIVHYNHWTNGPILHFSGVRGWILWVGVSIMVADSAVQLITVSVYAAKGIYHVILRIIQFWKERNEKKFQSVNTLTVSNAPMSTDERPLTPQYIPWYFPSVGLILSTLLLIFVGQFIFNIQFYYVIIAIPIGFVLSLIATRCAGETDINPVGGMGKVTQLVYAGIAPRQITTNLLSASIVASGASQCSDMMQDLKTGFLIKVSPRKQFIAQCTGIFFGIILCVPVYKLYDAAYHIGGDDVPAPAAHAWKAVAEILAQGFGALPRHSPWGILVGFIFGFILSGTQKIVSLIPKKGETLSQFFPSALAFGIGMIVPPKQGLTMFAGAIIFHIWRCVSKDASKKYFFTLSSGLVAGEGLIGMVVAILKLLGVKPLFEP